MKRTALLSVLAYPWGTSEQPIFLFPSQLEHDSYLQLDAEQASAVLSHHLHLDAFAEPYAASVLGKNDHVFDDYMSQIAHNGETFVGQGLQPAMIVNVESNSAGRVVC